MKIKLTKAITYQDKEYKEIEFDFDSLTGAEILEASSVFQGIGTSGDMNKMYESLLPQLSMQFQAKVAAMAAKVPYEVVLKLPATEFLQVTNMAKSFLLPSA